MSDTQATTLNENAAWLRQVPLFSAMEENKLRMLAFASERLTLAAGDYLFRQGDSADASYVVVAGKVAIIHEDQDGAHDIVTQGEGELVGELSLFTEEPCLTSAKAVEPLQLLRISKVIHIRMLHEFPEIAVGMTQILAEALSTGLKEIFRLRRIVRKYEPESEVAEALRPGSGQRTSGTAGQ